jgi:LysM repeat protein
VFFVIQPGNTLFMLARLFGTTVEAILAVNPQICDPNLIFPGQVIFIPTAKFPTPPPSSPPRFFVVVQPGETLFIIARRHGITLTELLAVNPQIVDPNLIFPGMVVNLPPTGLCRVRGTPPVDP